MIHLAFIRTAADKSVAALKKDFHEQFKVRRRNAARRQQALSTGTTRPLSTTHSDVWADDEDDYENDDMNEFGERESAESVDLRGFSFAFTGNNNNNNNNNTTESLTHSPHILDLREEEGFANGKKRHFRRVFVRCADSGPYQDVGWILTGDADHCMACTKPFGNVFFAKKHHCRACGNVICDACSLEELVDLLEPLGPQRVCRMCFFDQSPVQAVRHRDAGVSLLLNSHENEALVLQEQQQQQQPMQEGSSKKHIDTQRTEDEEEEEEVAQLTYWHFGEVTLQSLKPGFVLKAQDQKRVLYINVCGCDAVPQNALTNERGQPVYPMVVGEKGVAVNGSVVRDVAMNEYLLAKARFDSDIKGEIAAQVLAGVVRVTGEKPLRNYSFAQQTYLARNAPSQEPPVLAIPAQSVFSFLIQVGTRLSDAQRPLALPPHDDMEMAQESLAEATPEELKRVRAILCPPEFESASLSAIVSPVVNAAVTSPKAAPNRPLPSVPQNSAFSFDETRIESKPNTHTSATPHAPPPTLRTQKSTNLSSPAKNNSSNSNNFTRPPLTQQRSTNINPVDITQDTRSAKEKVPLLVLPEGVNTRSRVNQQPKQQPLSGRPPLDPSHSGTFRPQSVPVTTSNIYVQGYTSQCPLTSPPLTLRRRTDTTIKQLALVPRPGFVIKTFLRNSNNMNGAGFEMFTDDNQKIFVNVFQHEVADKLQAAVALVRSEDVNDRDIFVLFADKSSVEDKNGQQTLLYNVCVGASHFNSSNPDSLEIVSRDSVAQILRKINGQFHDDLDTSNFVLPRVKGGFKGDLPEAPVVFRYLAPIDMPPLTSRSAASTQLFFPRNKGAGEGGEGSVAGGASVSGKLIRGPSVRGRGDSFSRMSSITPRSVPGAPLESPRSQLTDSPVSSLSSTVDPNGVKTKKSFFSFSMNSSSEDLREGERMVRNEPMSLRGAKPLNRVEEETIRRKSLENAEWLVGYHITVYESSGMKSNYITTGSRRATFGKTEFRLSAPGKDDRWAHLKRAEHKSGLPFKINHKVKLVAENGQVLSKNN